VAVDAAVLRGPHDRWVTMPNSELQSVQMEVQSLPRDVRVRVSTSLEKMHADKNVGQNLTMMLQSGIIPPQVAQTMLDVFLPLVVKDPEVARQVMERINIDKEINHRGLRPRNPWEGQMPNYSLNTGLPEKSRTLEDKGFHGMSFHSTSPPTAIRGPDVSGREAAPSDQRGHQHLGHHDLSVARRCR